MSDLMFTLSAIQIANPALLMQALLAQGASLDSVVWLGFISQLRGVIHDGIADSGKLESAIPALDTYLSDYRNRANVQTRLGKTQPLAKTGNVESSKLGESAGMGFKVYALDMYKLTASESRAVYDAFKYETISMVYDASFVNYRRDNAKPLTKTQQTRMRKAVTAEYSNRREWLSIGYTVVDTDSASVTPESTGLNAGDVQAMIAANNETLLASIAALVKPTK